MGDRFLISTMLLSGCRTIMPRYLGIRPDAIDIVPSETMKGKCEARHPGKGSESLIAACREYEGYVEWANQLVESYKTRATMNEWAIYVAGTIALGALGAIGGLGIAAAAATETIALIGVSSGFAAGFFGMLNNSDQAGLYVASRPAATSSPPRRRQRRSNTRPGRTSPNFSDWPWRGRWSTSSRATSLQRVVWSTSSSPASTSTSTRKRSGSLSTASQRCSIRPAPTAARSRTRRFPRRPPASRSRSYTCKVGPVTLHGERQIRYQ